MVTLRILAPWRYLCGIGFQSACQVEVRGHFSLACPLGTIYNSPAENFGGAGCGVC